MPNSPSSIVDFTASTDSESKQNVVEPGLTLDYTAVAAPGVVDPECGDPPVENVGFVLNRFHSRDICMISQPPRHSAVFSHNFQTGDPVEPNYYSYDFGCQWLHNALLVETQSMEETRQFKTAPRISAENVEREWAELAPMPDRKEMWCASRHDTLDGVDHIWCPSENKCRAIVKYVPVYTVTSVASSN
ncbi:hypothetical protein B0H19DRAFT_1244337 [Mycena capillaripes]|nr:hypothetical protein B0H19DRAFT_1244337 [Mycena capillaripes]